MFYTMVALECSGAENNFLDTSSLFRSFGSVVQAEIMLPFSSDGSVVADNTENDVPAEDLLFASNIIEMFIEGSSLADLGLDASQVELLQLYFPASFALMPFAQERPLSFLNPVVLYDGSRRIIITESIEREPMRIDDAWEMESVNAIFVNVRDVDVDSGAIIYSTYAFKAEDFDFYYGNSVDAILSSLEGRVPYAMQSYIYNQDDGLFDVEAAYFSEAGIDIIQQGRVSLHEDGFVWSAAEGSFKFYFDESNSTLNIENYLLDEMISSTAIHCDEDSGSIIIKEGDYEIIISDVEFSQSLYDGSIVAYGDDDGSIQDGVFTYYEIKHWTTIMKNDELVESWYDISHTANDSSYRIKIYSQSADSSSPEFYALQYQEIGDDAASIRKYAIEQDEEEGLLYRKVFHVWDSSYAPGSSSRMYYIEDTPEDWQNASWFLQSVIDEHCQLICQSDTVVSAGKDGDIVITNNAFYNSVTITSDYDESIPGGFLQLIESYREYLSSNHLLSRPEVEEVINITTTKVLYQDIRLPYTSQFLEMIDKNTGSNHLSSLENKSEIKINIVNEVARAYLERGISFFGSAWSLPSGFTQFSFEFRSLIHNTVVPELQGMVPYEWDYDEGILILYPDSDS